MTFSKRKELHDRILNTELPSVFSELGIQFKARGYETSIARNGLIISNLEDETSRELRFTPDGIASYRGLYLVELKTKLPEQKSLNYDFEMSPYEKAMALHDDGALTAYIFYPDWRVCWVKDAKPDFIVVPNWRWSKQDYLRIKHRYANICPVHYTPVSPEGSGTVLGVILYDRIQVMPTFKNFWLEVIGRCRMPKQLRLT